jgi:hypothetical protein
MSLDEEVEEKEYLWAAVRAHRHYYEQSIEQSLNAQAVAQKIQDVRYLQSIGYTLHFFKKDDNEYYYKISRNGRIGFDGVSKNLGNIAIEDERKDSVKKS